MSNRANYLKAAPGAIEILFKQEQYLTERFTQHNQLNITLWELLKLRISQINQCAYCIDMHSKNALKSGENYQRIVALSAWRESPLYSQQERSALNWAELVTKEMSATDLEYEKLSNTFDDAEIFDLTVAVNAINSWNRVARIFQPVVGSYQA